MVRYTLKQDSRNKKKADINSGVQCNRNGYCLRTPVHNMSGPTRPEILIPVFLTEDYPNKAQCLVHTAGSPLIFLLTGLGGGGGALDGGGGALEEERLSAGGGAEEGGGKTAKYISALIRSLPLSPIQ